MPTADSGRFDKQAELGVVQGSRRFPAAVSNSQLLRKTCSPEVLKNLFVDRHVFKLGAAPPRSGEPPVDSHDVSGDLFGLFIHSGSDERARQPRFTKSRVRFHGYGPA